MGEIGQGWVRGNGEVYLFEDVAGRRQVLLEIVGNAAGRGRSSVGSKGKVQRRKRVHRWGKRGTPGVKKEICLNLIFVTSKTFCQDQTPF